MILGIESVYGDKRLVGKTMSLGELKNAVKEILEKHEAINFVSVFCSRFGYKEMPYNDGYAAYIVDLDTSLVFVTLYTFPKELDGAKGLYFTERGVFEPVYHSGGEVAHNVAYLAICKYDNDEAYYIFHCDESLEVVADGCWDNIELCKKYMPGYNVKWLKQKD